VSNVHPEALPLLAEAQVFSCFLQKERIVEHSLASRRGAYLYVLEGGPVQVKGGVLPALAAAQIRGESEFKVYARNDAELILVDVLLI
jgi:redox-sensitive bicupin YhaK (pirin superfamily)